MSLPISLVRILQWKDSSCVFQAGRVAANLAADCGREDSCPQG